LNIFSHVVATKGRKFQALISFLGVNFSKLWMFEILFFLKQNIVEVNKVVVHNDDVTHGVQLMLMSTY
jgi:hypothetical protein